MTTCKPTCSTVTDKETYEERNTAYNKDVKTYIDKWPEYCTDCGGWGGKTSRYDPSPAGISLSPGYFTEYDLCAECVEKDICPRCGEKTIVLIEGTDRESGLTDDHCECTSCKWIELKTEGLSQDPPEPPECDCWEWEGWEA